MSVFARIQGGMVAEFFSPPPSVAITQCFDPALVWVDVTTVSPAPQQGWTATDTAGVWTFAAPAALPAPTLAELAYAASGAGLTIALSGALTLTATLFPSDEETQIKLGAVITTVTATNAFPGGATSYPMKDAVGAWHTFTVTQYVTVAGAIAAYVSALDLIADGNPLGATSLPTSSVSLTV